MSEHSARQRLGRARARTIASAIGAVWAWDALVALLAAWPAASLARAAFAGDPDGDALLWRPGAHALLSFLARDGDGVRAAADSAALVLVVGAAASLVPMATLMMAVGPSTPGHRWRGLASTMGPSFRVFPRLALLLVVFGLAEAAVIGAAFILGPFVGGMARESLGEARGDQLAVATGGVLALGAAWLAILHDLARAAVVRLRASALQSIGAALRAMRAGRGSLAWSWAWRSAASFVPPVAVAEIATRIDARRALPLLGGALAHQTVVLIRIGFRASWLAMALRSVRSAP